MKIHYSLLGLLLSSTQLSGQQGNLPNFFHQSTQINAVVETIRPVYKLSTSQRSIMIDGKPAEKAWQEANSAQGFWMHSPRDDRAETFKTEIKICADQKHLYILAICQDPNPPVLTSRKRDANFWDQDGIAIILDPIDKQTNGYLFGTTAAGIQTEGLLLNGGRSTDKNWDTEWSVNTLQAKDHWVAEIAIPLEVLRFSKGNRDWGINFIRIEMSDNSTHSWVPIPRNINKTNLAFTGLLRWDNPPKNTNKGKSLIPYLTQQLSQDFRNEQVNQMKTGIGLDAKFTLSPTLTLDATFNPDFSQVEADEQITNVSRFNIRLPERRVFFMENKDLFEDFSSSRVRPFFSRQIGLDHKRRPIPILFGLRLNGNLNQQLRMGLLNVQTQVAEEKAGQNYTAAVFHQRILSRSTLKGFLINRQTIETRGVNTQDYGRNAGLEFEYISTDNKWSSEAAYNHSFKPGIERHNAYYKLGARYRNRGVSAFLNWYEVQDEYYADIGFLRNIEHYDAKRDTSIRIGYGSFYSAVTFTFVPTSERRFTAQRFSFTNQLQLRATGRDILERKTAFSYQMRFPGDSKIELSINSREVHLQYPFSFTRSSPLPVDTYHNNGLKIETRTDGRKSVYGKLTGRYESFYGGTRLGLSSSLYYRMNTWGKLGVKMEYNDLQFPKPYGSRRLFSIRPKLYINFNENLFLKTFIQYNSQREQLNINARLQWRFAPLSDLYFVYTDNYLAETGTLEEQIGWLSLRPNKRSLIMKINYWLDW